MILKQISILILAVLISTTVFSQDLKAPENFLPNNYKKEFTAHHDLVDYFEYIAANSDQVKLVEYGRTNQNRPLLVVYVSAKENIANLESIRLNHLSQADMSNNETKSESDKVIVWLSYSVHGNEASGSECAMSVIHNLTDPSKQEIQSWLENTIVIIDPSLNPDGYSRYTHWVKNVGGKNANTNPVDIEHNEPWPGGRVNHYLFDLNRDWAWLTQVESQQRMKVYSKWLPHIHADLHEMFHNDPYYFAPAARPYHEYITDFQADFQNDIGKNHAHYFDENGWMYFTGEVFDLFYPSYGDTYPTFNGSIGMTYEQGGHSRAGRAIKRDNGQILKLEDRIEHHLTTSLSTIEIASKNSEKLISNFNKYFSNSAKNPQGKYKSFILKTQGKEAQVKQLCHLLDQHGIKYGSLDDSKKVEAFDYNTGKNKTIEVDPSDLVVSAYQAKSVLVQVLMDPSSQLEDSLTYDITAWALPYAYGLQAYASESKLKPATDFSYVSSAEPNKTDNSTYAYALKWGNLNSAKKLGDLLENKIQVRIATKAFKIGDHKYEAGTVVVNREDNRQLENFVETVAAILEGSDYHPLQTGFTSSGPDLGSSSMRLLKKLNVLSIRGDGINANAFGEVKYYFEQDLQYPLTVVEKSQLSRIDLSKFHVLILPDGNYGLEKNVVKSVQEWIAKGGKLIVIGGANMRIADSDGFALKSYATDEDKSKAASEKKMEALAARRNHYSGAERRSIANYAPGSIVRYNVDDSNPLGFGMGNEYFSLKTNSFTYPLLKGAWNVAYVEKEPMVIGFMGNKVKKRMSESIGFAVEQKAAGSIIYMIDNPLFRGFWYNGKVLFANALFFAGK